MATSLAGWVRFDFEVRFDRGELAMAQASDMFKMMDDGDDLSRLNVIDFDPARNVMWWQYAGPVDQVAVAMAALPGILENMAVMQ